MNLSAAPGVAVREFRMARARVRRLPAVRQRQGSWSVEAKPAGYALTNVELQAGKYATVCPRCSISAQSAPVSLLSTGVETRFINGLDPDPKTRAISANLKSIDPRRSPSGLGRDARRMGEAAARRGKWVLHGSGRHEAIVAPRAPATLPRRARLALHEQGRGDHAPGAVASSEPAARPDPDGDRLAARPSWPSPRSTA